MSSSPECSVLIPSSTLEDFPTDLNDCDACSLLAAWSTAWHPVLIAQSAQAPSWYRADAPPEPHLANASANDRNTDDFGGRTFIVPGVSIDQLPAGYADRVQATGARWITGADRAGYLRCLGLDSTESVSKTLHHDGKTVSAADFFAAGYVALQVQILTRRLRYTSNLDQIHFESCLVQAAEAFVNDNAEAAINQLHSVFDALAEERDHYFTSDPHLIDLTLVTASTLDQAIEMPVNSLGVPANFLLDSTAILALSDRTDAPARKFCDSFAPNADSDKDSDEPTHSNATKGSSGLACGGPPSEWVIEFASDAEIERTLREHRDLAVSCLGVAPRVFARFSGGVFGAMVPTIKRLGYQGMLTNDFVAGTGIGKESKVLLSCGDRHNEIEALTTQPIDAASDAAFLAFGPKLGEAIDSGEIATGLLVHWPESQASGSQAPKKQCDSFLDVKRAARWGVALGRFWSLEDYFVSGERPYHEGQLASSAGQAATLLDEMVERGETDALSNRATVFRADVRRESDQTLIALAAMVSGNEPSNTEGQSITSEDTDQAMTQLARSVGAIPSGDAEGRLLFNPHAMAVRTHAELKVAPRRGDHVFAVSSDEGAVTASIDVPGYGFSMVVPDPVGNSVAGAPSLVKRLRDKFLGKPSSICDGNSLHNEFMEVTIDAVTGSIAAVHSGQTRGNRFSMRLVGVGLSASPAPKVPETEEGTEASHQTTVSPGSTVSPVAAASNGVMACDKIETLTQSSAAGSIRCTGRLLDVVSSDSNTLRELAKFQITYTLRRGSRLIETRVVLEPSDDAYLESGSAELSGKSTSPWQNYFALRCAVAEDSSVIRSISRDRLVRTGKRQLISPLGVVIDEASRKTLIASHGLPFHKAVGDRFIDTLIHVQGETHKDSAIDFGFDVVEPVCTAMAAIQSPYMTPASLPDSITATGWFAHLSPRGILMRDARFHQLANGETVLTMRLVQTKGKSETAKVQCFRDLRAGYRIDRDLASFLADLRAELAGSQNSPTLQGMELSINNGVAKIPLASHGAAQVAFILQNDLPHAPE